MNYCIANTSVKLCVFLSFVFARGIHLSVEFINDVVFISHIFVVTVLLLLMMMMTTTMFCSALFCCFEARFVWRFESV